MTTYEQRQALIEAARGLKEAITGFNLNANALVNRLLSEADILLREAASEVEAGEQTTRKIVTYGAKGHGTVSAAAPVKAAQVSEVPKLGPGKRACSVCRKPGHRAQNCPETDNRLLELRNKKGK